MSTIGPGQKAALLEAYVAVVSLLSLSLRAEFPIIGGASLVMLGSQRRTEDVAFQVSTAALMAFEETVCNDRRFSKDKNATWTNSCQGEGIEGVNIKVVKKMGEGFRAGMGELVRMKANAYTGPGEPKDVADVGFLLDKMEETGEGVEGVERKEEDLEDMKEAAAESGKRRRRNLERGGGGIWKEAAAESGKRHSNLLKEMLRKAGH